MFDANYFKRQVKEWMRAHPEGELADLQDYCDELIPPAQFASYQWLIDQTMEWYKHIITHREIVRYSDEEQDESIA